MRERTGTWISLAALAVVAVFSLEGCASRSGGGGGGGGAGGTGGTVSAPVALGTEPGGVGEFMVTAGQPTEKTVTVDFNLNTSPNSTVSGGTFGLDPNAVTFEPASNPGKARAAAQAAPFEFTVTGWAFPRQPLGACGDGDQYGPYTVGVDATGEVISVAGSPQTIQPLTAQLIADNNLAICLHIESPVSGTVRISELDFEITIAAGESDVQPPTDGNSGGNGSCREFGESCTSDADCCGGLPCVDGVCI